MSLLKVQIKKIFLYSTNYIILISRHKDKCLTLNAQDEKQRTDKRTRKTMKISKQMLTEIGGVPSTAVPTFWFSSIAKV